MIAPQDGFSSTYAQARVRFLEGAAAAGMSISSHNHPLAGREGETLAVDVALDGPPDAERLLIVSSACHGVEGHCGSGVQVFATHDAEWREHARSAGVSVLYLHALNPYGFSWGRRTTHENVDLNRNFLDFAQPLPDNPAYADLHALLLPPQWPPGPENVAALDAYVAQRGLAAFQSAVTQGQYAFADGVFYGGSAPTWSQQTLRAVLRRHARSARHLAWIDLHSGLGPTGVGERIFACRNEASALQRARDWWGQITSVYDGSSTSALLNGTMWNVVYDECPKAQYTGIALEFGTVPIHELIDALRADTWLYQHPQAAPALQEAIRRQVLAAAYVDNEVWKAQIVVQSRQAMFQAVDGLAASR